MHYQCTTVSMATEPRHEDEQTEAVHEEKDMRYKSPRLLARLLTCLRREDSRGCSYCNSRARTLRGCAEGKEQHG